jgi:hypothetical protein
MVAVAVLPGVDELGTESRTASLLSNYSCLLREGSTGDYKCKETPRGK